MSKEAASILLDLMLKHGREQDQALADIQQMCDAETFNRYRRMIAESMATMLLDVINPLTKEYPELRPDGLD